MVIFLDHQDKQYGAQAEITVTNAVNGERSISGTIYTNSKVLKNIGRGWRMKRGDEFYVVTFVKPKDEKKNIEVSFDAVHQFFWDFYKSQPTDILEDGSHPFEIYLQNIFKDSGYEYKIGNLKIAAFRKQSFNYKNRLTLFNDLIKSTDLEFTVHGRVVRILERVGTDLSTVVRKNFNMNELTIEKDIKGFYTAQKGYGAFFDEQDHSKGRHQTEYVSPLASVFGRLEADPVTDERYTDMDYLKARLKENVENSYRVSVQIDMEDLIAAGYRYKRPLAGDYIMAINETLDYREKVRIVSFTTKYDVRGKLVSHKVVCNDVGTVKKHETSYSNLNSKVSRQEELMEDVVKVAQQALVSANGKNKNYYGTEKPLDIPKGRLIKGDHLYLQVGEETVLYFWNGTEWELDPLGLDLTNFKRDYTANKKEVKDGIEQAKAKAEVVKAGVLAQVEQKISQSKSEVVTQVTRDFNDSLTTTANQLREAAKREVNDKFAQAESNATRIRNDVNSQLTELEKAKQELANVKSAQSTYEQTTQRSLSQLTNLVDGKAERSYVEQKANELLSKVSAIKVGSRNYAEDYSFTRGLWEYSQGDSSTKNWNVTDGIYTVSGTTNGWKQFQIHSESGTRKGGKRDSTALLELKEGETYTLSVEVKCNSGSPDFWLELRDNGLKNYDKVVTHLGGSGKTVTATNEWKRYSITSVIKPNSDFSHRRIILGYSAIGSISFRKVELTQSSVFTDAGPAPEDQEAIVTAVESTLKQRADSIEAGVTKLTEGLKTKADSSQLTLLSDTIKQSVKQLETDTQNKLNEKVSSADFTVRANQIEQTVQQVSSSKADKSMVTQEAGRIREEISKIQVGGRNLLRNSKGDFQPSRGQSIVGFDNWQYYPDTTVYLEQGKKYILSAKTDGEFSNSHRGQEESDRVVIWLASSNRQINQIVSDDKTGTTGTVFTWNRPTGTYHLRGNTYHKEPRKKIWEVKIEQGTLRTDWTPAPEDQEYQLTEAKSTFERTASRITQSISTLENSVLKKADVTIEDGRIVLGAGKVVDGNKIASLFVTQPESITAITNKMIITPHNQNLVSESYQGAWQPFYDDDVAITPALKVGDVKEFLLSGKVRRVKGNAGGIYFNYEVKQGTGNVSYVGGRTTTITRGDAHEFSFSVRLWYNFVGPVKSVQFFMHGSDDTNTWEVSELKIIAKQSAELIVDGTITARHLASQSIETAHLKAGSVTSTILAANAVTADKIQADSAFFNKITTNGLFAKGVQAVDIIADKITSGTLNARQVRVINLDANNIVSGTMSANLIRGGILSALNGATKFNLNTGILEFYTDSPALRRVLAGYPNQFLKFETGSFTNYGKTIPVGVTVIGSNRWNSEDANDGGFVGLRMWNGHHGSTDVDEIDIVADKIDLVHSAFKTPAGWTITTTDAPNIRPYNSNQRRAAYIEVGDIKMWYNNSDYRWIRSIFNSIFDNLRLLHNNKETSNSYNYSVPDNF